MPGPDMPLGNAKRKKKLAEGGRAGKLMDDSVRKEYIQCDFCRAYCVSVCVCGSVGFKLTVL